MFVGTNNVSMETIGKNSTLARAYLVMKHRGMSAIPVYQETETVGVISLEAIKKAINEWERGGGTDALIVGNFMTFPIKIVPSVEMENGGNFERLLQSSGAAAFVFLEADGKLMHIAFRDELTDEINGRKSKRKAAS